MTRYLTIAARLTGTNIERINRSTDKSRTKVIALSIAMLVPTMLWTVCSFLLAYVIMEASFPAALSIGLFFGAIVLIIERLVVMGNGHWVLYSFRFLLAGVVAWLGSQLFDLVIFRQDIEQQLPAIRHEMALKAQQQKQAELEQRYDIGNKMVAMSRLDSLTANYQQQALAEAAGLSNNRQKGAGSATKFKQLQADKAHAEARLMHGEIDSLVSAGAIVKQAAYDSAYARFDEKSLLFRMKAMKQLLTEHSEMMTTYWLITAFLIFVELIVVIFKITWPKTAYEKEIEILDKLHQERSERMLGSLQHQHPAAAQKKQMLATRLNTLL